MRSFGMTPVLPAFSGHVPAALATHYPSANVQKLDPWHFGFNGTYFLDPLDELFAEIGTRFIETQTSVYGTDNFFSCDPFNEVNPPSSDPDYLSAVSKAVFSSMRSGDEAAIWVLQGWFLVHNRLFWRADQARAFLDAVPDDGLVLLDLWAEMQPIWEENLFYGKQFIWNMLHNYGGRSGLYGSLPRVAAGPPTALANSSARIVGTGFSMEAIETNPIVYDLMSEMHWRTSPPDVDGWVRGYVSRRYGQSVASETLLDAWTLLAHGVYSCNRTHQPGTSGSVIAARPDRVIERVGCCAPVPLYFDADDVCNAWAAFVDEGRRAPQLAQQAAFSYDLTTVTTQALSDLMIRWHWELLRAFHRSNSHKFDLVAANITALITDLDVLLRTQPKLLLGKWLADAKAWASTDAEWVTYQYNARLQLSLWGKAGHLVDYAYKLWGGLVGDYYLRRWGCFVDSLRANITAPSAWDLLAYTAQVKTLEQQWTLDTDCSNYGALPVGDTLQVAGSLLEKYHGVC
eukprot:TRINITY_DN4212_c0_g1_i2.p1 TRINITY_DN4212_c0_g1~~TRINITY_DN4212_c0_g1_i2.p1  ORF type:complete len:515 (-),score=101.45 TRINITY_DN4212_c0_g1_i2:67-1611(-)